MDVWAWVHETIAELEETGHGRLARILEDVSSLTVDGQHEQVEALVPEGLMLARAIDQPWLEVYLRHWLAQSRILHRHDVRDMDEVIRLLDFAHGDRTRDCPQSVCATQDFCSAYGVLDGPGFGEERVAAAGEALARIDPSWPCFGCISVERAAALMDLGRHAEAEAFCEQQLRAGRRAQLTEVSLARADALLRLGRLEDARAQLARVKTTAEMKSIQIDHALLESELRALAGDCAAALERLPPAPEIEPGDYVKWTGTMRRICAARPELNDAALGATLRGFCATLRANGSLYNQANVALGAAELALDRDRHALAALHLDEVAELLPRLRNPAGPREWYSALNARLRTTSAPPLDETVLLASLGSDPERDLEALMPAVTAAPDHESLTRALAETLGVLGFAERARAVLERFVAAHPMALATADDLMRRLVADRDESALRAFIANAPRELGATAQFRLGRLMLERARWAEAAEAFERARALEDAPVRATLSNLAYAQRQLGRLEESLALLDELATDPEDTSDDWDRMVVATLLGRHDTVRDSARRLGFEFEGAGPIDQPYAYCHVVLRDAAGRDEPWYALRISPVVARIIAMSTPGQPCPYRDEVVFEPVALNPIPEGEERSEDYVPSFRGLRTLKHGGYRTYDLDGVHPGDEKIEALRAALRAIDVALSVRSGESYELPGSDGETRRGVYIFIAVPAQVTTDAVYRVLAEAGRDWQTPLTYRGLLRELGLEAELAAHEQIAIDLNL